MTRFFKYSGAGNDFILFEEERISPHLIPALCDRKRGVGADGVLFLKREGPSSFRMQIFNADGSEPMMCGNGLRSVFFHLYRFYPAEAPFEVILPVSRHGGSMALNGEIKIEMGEVKWGAVDQPFSLHLCDLLDTGVPHLVLKSVPKVPFLELAPSLRHHPNLPFGANVNLLDKVGNEWRVTTFERGVEGITDACGTGVVACALSLSLKEGLKGPLTLLTFGGERLTVDWEGEAAAPQKVTLQGKVSPIFEGKLLAGSL